MAGFTLSGAVGGVCAGLLVPVCLVLLRERVIGEGRVRG